MIYLRIKPEETKPAIINLIAGSLEAGQVAVLPTDTIYGLSCLADNVKAIRRIRRLKKRDAQKPLIALVSSLRMLKKYVFVSRRQEIILKKLWRRFARPTTIILRERRVLPRELTGNSAGLAIRLPKSRFLIKILERIGRPLVSTSLNLSGQDHISNPKYLTGYFPKKELLPDLVVDAGKCRRRRPSRLIDLRDENNPLLLRK